MSAETARDASPDLTEILAAIRAGGDKAELVDRLVDLAGSFTGSAAEAALLAKIGACRGWGGVVAKLPRPAKGRPSLRVVTEEDDGGDGADDMSAAYPAAPGLPEGWSDPGGWICSSKGIVRRGTDANGETVWRVVSVAPIWISERWAEMPEHRSLHADGQRMIYVRLRWPGGSVVVPQDVALTANLLQGLSAQDAPVDSDSARRIVPWLAASLERNRGILPARTMVQRLGWVAVEGERVFQTPDGPYRLRPSDIASEQTACALRPSGTWKGWLEVAEVAHRAPLSAVMLSASVASVLLDLCGADPFVVEVFGRTSGGKTTHMQWAASAWGNSTKTKGAYIMDWQDSATTMERVAAFLNSYPLFMDDTKKLGEERIQELVRAVYGWGSGKGRGTVTGRQEVSAWRSILFSTGEAQIAQMVRGKHAGMNARMLPFANRLHPDGEASVMLMKKSLHWGHAGPRVVEWGLERAQSLPSDHQRIAAVWAAELGGTEVSHRVASMLAAIQIGARALREIGVPMPAWEGAMKPILLAAAMEAMEAVNVASGAWEAVAGWLASLPHRVQGSGFGTAPPAGGWLGRVMPGGGVGVLHTHLDEYLRSVRYNPADVLPKWQADGLIDPGKVAKLNGRTVRLCWLKSLDWAPEGAETPEE